MKNELKEEYIGFNIEVIETKNQTLQGLKGEILDETKNTFKIKTKDKIKIILKKGNIFKIKNKIINGNEIIKKPEERIKIKN
ncbi:MAG: ribonuclease P protein subunit [Nanoarchaeota archaeon]|nr:ribonuclease P protein subunit [Nanoarchaeota archaeon]MBU1030515.1 ribonuclease P protein subunit [Nanoarchaeota archaeon]MBU1850473.1 ribonuclease P protein subunit [Nanoarchaeota archaeon]